MSLAPLTGKRSAGTKLFARTVVLGGEERSAGISTPQEIGEHMRRVWTESFRKFQIDFLQAESLEDKTSIYRDFSEKMDRDYSRLLDLYHTPKKIDELFWDFTGRADDFYSWGTGK